METASKSRMHRLAIQHGVNPARPVCDPVNDPARRGMPAGHGVMVGPHHFVFPVHTRFDAVCWFALDQRIVDPVTGGFEVVRQLPTFEQVVASLPKE